MKSVLKLSALFTALLLILPTGCEKLSDEELLTSHVWRFKELTTTSTDQNIIALVAFTNALMVNATMEFRKDGTYILSALNKTSEGTWDLSADGTVLTIEPAGENADTMTVVKLTKEDLILQGTESHESYGTYSVTMHWIK